MNKVNEFRISIAIEDPKSGGMLLLVGVEVSPNSIDLGRMNDDQATGRDLLPAQLEGSFSCSMKTWMRIKGEAVKQGVQWTQGLTKTKAPNTYWSSKPKVTVIHVRHGGLLDGADAVFSVEPTPTGDRLMGNIDDRVERVVVRDRRVMTAIEGL
jgi:hypothetical protein